MDSSRRSLEKGDQGSGSRKKVKSDVSSNVPENWREQVEFGRRFLFMFLNGLLSDLKLVVYGKGGDKREFQTHKFVLQAQSGGFEQMLSERVNQNSLTLHDCDLEVFGTFIEGLYWNYTIVDSLGLQQLLDIWVLTALYQADPFFKYIAAKIPKLLEENKGSAAMILQAALEVEELNLSELALRTIIFHTKKVLNHADFCKLKKGTVELIVKQTFLSVEEHVLFKAVCRWGRMQCSDEYCSVQDFREQLEGIIQEIRFLSMNLAEFTNAAGDSELLTTGERLSFMKALHCPESHQIPQEFNGTKRRSPLTCNKCFKIHCETVGGAACCVLCKTKHCNKFTLKICTLKFCHNCKKCSCANSKVRLHDGKKCFPNQCQAMKTVCQSCGSNHCERSARVCMYCNGEHCFAYGPLEIKVCWW